MAQVLDLKAMPPALGLYAKALAPTRRPSVAAGLPEREVQLLGHRSTVTEVAAYDRVCGFVLGDELPATWLHVLTFPLQLTLMTAPGFPLALAGLVHVSNSMVQVRPALIGEALDLRVRAENLRPHRRGVLVDLVGEAAVAGETVWQGRSVYLSRQARLAPAPEPGASPVPSGRQEGRGVVGEASRSLSSANGSHSVPADDAAGTASAPSLQMAGLWRLPADLGRRYAAVSGDVNPIHLSALSAKAFGFPRAIAHGMCTHARVLAALQPRLPQVYEVSVQFIKPVLLPSTVRLALGESEQGFSAQVTNRAADRVFLTLSTQ